MKDLNVLTVTQDENGHFSINLVMQQGEYDNADIAHWAITQPVTLQKDELLDVITLLSRAIMHIKSVAENSSRNGRAFGPASAT